MLTQAETQTTQHKELSQVHHSCLGDIRQRAEGFNNSQKALELTAEALISQRERDSEQYSHGMQTMYQKTSGRDQILRERMLKGDQDRHTDQMQKNEIAMSHQRIQRMEQQMMIADTAPPTVQPSTTTNDPMAGNPTVMPSRREESSFSDNVGQDGRNLPSRSANFTGNMTVHYGVKITAPIIDACPAFTPATYSQWKREVKLRIDAQNGATETQL